MEESDDAMSSDDLKNIYGTVPEKVKPKKRSLVERELETSLTEHFTSPISYGEAFSKSRYGRARRFKTDTNYYDTEKAVTEVLKSPNMEKTPSKSHPPAYKMHASNSPVTESTKRISVEGNLENQIENIYNTNIALSRFGSEEKKNSPSPAKKFPKVYIRKDLIQTKEKEETVTLIKNLFSPVKNSYKQSNSHLSNILERSSEKYNLNGSVAAKQNGYYDNASVVKMLDFDDNKRKKKENKELSRPVLSKSEQFELEAKCLFQVGDLAWARMGTYPFWPCIVTREPLSDMFVRKKLFGRMERDVVHVTFFGDNGRRSWIVHSMLRPFLGLQEFEITRDQFTPKAKKKDPRLYAAFFISDKKQALWSMSVQEAESLMREPKRLRIDIFYDMLEKSKTKVTPKSQKSGKITRTDSDVSLSESLLDTLFSEGDRKNDDLDRSRNKSLDVSEVVTACLDNMAAKTGITKIQRQSHMDRWLQKAKSKTPEKNQLKVTVTVERIEKDKDKSKGKEKDTKTSESKRKKKFLSKESTCNPSPYSFRMSVRESQNLLCHQNEHDYSKYSECEDDISLKAINVDAIQSPIEPVPNISVIDKVESLNENVNKIIGKDVTERETEVVNKDQTLTSEVETISNTDENPSREDENLNEAIITESKDLNRLNNKKVTTDEIINSNLVESDQPINKDDVNAMEIAEINDNLPARSEQFVNRETIRTEVTEDLGFLERDFETTIKGDSSVKHLENDSDSKKSDKENTQISTNRLETALLKETLLSDISSEDMDVDKTIHENVVDGETNEYEHLDMLYDNLENSNDVIKKSCVKVKNQEIVHKSNEATSVNVNEGDQNYTCAVSDSVNDLIPKTNDKDFVTQVIEKNEVYSKTINEHTISTISSEDLPQERTKTKTANSMAEIISLDEDSIDCESSNVCIITDVKEEMTFLTDVNKQIHLTPVKKTTKDEMSTDDDITDCESIITYCSDTNINTKNGTVELDNVEEQNNLCDFDVKTVKDCIAGCDVKNAVVTDNGTVSIEKTILHEGLTSDSHGQVQVESTVKNNNVNCVPFDVENSGKGVKEGTEIEENSYDDDYSDDDDDIEQPAYSPHCPQSEEKVNLITESLEIVSQKNLDRETVLLNPTKIDTSTNQILPHIAKVTSTSTQAVKKVKDFNEMKTELGSDNDSMSSELDNVALSELRRAFKNKTLQNGSTKLFKGAMGSKASHSDTELFPKRELRSRISKSPTSSIKENGFHSSKDTSPERVAKQECDTISIISINSEDSNTSVSKRKVGKERQASADNMQNPEFLKYLELRQDSLIDEHPELTYEELVAYLYKTWQYEDSKKSDLMKTEDMESSHLVKGVIVNQELSQPKKKKMMKQRKIVDIVKVMGNEDFKPRERRKMIEPLYKEDFSDLEDEIEMFEIFKPKNKIKVENLKSEPSKAATENVPKAIEKTEDNKETTAEIKRDVLIDDIKDEYYDEEEAYFEQLTKPKPNVFKGMVREKVCEICENTSNLIKCKGCQGMFHIDCVNKKSEDEDIPMQSTRGRKKNKKKRGRKPKVSIDSNGVDSGSQSDEKSHDYNISEELNASVENVKAPILEPLVVDADNLEAQLEAKMKELVDSANIEYESYSSDDGIDWDKAVAGQCEIVEIKVKSKPVNLEVDYSDFKCKNCLDHEVPICLVCKSAVSPKDKSVRRQKCQVAHCQKYYHISCLDQWPQTQFNSGEPSRSNKKINEHFEALTCPRHVCHTCVCDDPRGCKTRFSSDKLARCVRCPATYHSFTKCLPAGTKILTASHIICPRHYEHRPGKVPCHVNTGWCFICALGGTLICCEYCPTSFHADCLNIEPPEGGYMCEDCETGRLPLYGEMVWVKLGHYRWWPGIILHPSEIPDNIMAVKHSHGEFVVRFFGQYDHYWVNRGRVFPFQEGDSGRISSQKSKIDEAFTKAMEHAQRAFEILKNVEANEEDPDIASSLLPPHYVKLKVNKPCGSLYGKRVDVEESSLTQCECNPDEEEPCGPYSHCLNRMLLTECGPLCRAGERCCNRAFEKRVYPKLTPYRTPHRGWGLKTLEDIKAGQFVIEYVGELIDEEEFKRRMRRKHEFRDENFYFLTLDKERMIDAGPKGNLARFMNHCCEPNCETQKWTVLGDVRVGLFALKDIPANSEVTFNYNLECAGIEKKRCLCGAKRCSGYIGAKPKQEESQPKKIKDKIPVKRTYKKRKAEESPSTSKMKPKRPVGRPAKRRELTEIEKDLLIIKQATNLSSDSEGSGRLSSIDTENERNAKPLKRKRVSFSTEEIIIYNGVSPSLKKVKLDDEKNEVGD